MTLGFIELHGQKALSGPSPKTRQTWPLKQPALWDVYARLYLITMNGEKGPGF